MGIMKRISIVATLMMLLPLLAQAKVTQISHNGITYNIPDTNNIQTFNPTLSNGSQASSEIKGLLFHATRALQRIESYNSASDVSKLSNELNRAVIRTNNNIDKAHALNGVENIAGLATSAGFGVYKKSAISATFFDSASAALISLVDTKLVAEKELNFLHIGKQTMVDVNVIAAQHESNKITFQTSSVASLDQIRQAELVMMDIKTSSQDLIPVFREIGNIKSGTVVERIAKGIVTSSLNGLTGLPVSTAAATLSLIIHVKEDEIKEKISNLISSSLGSADFELNDNTVSNTQNVATVIKLQQDVITKSALAISKAAEQVVAENARQQALNIANQKAVEVDTKIAYQNTLKATRKNMWGDLSDMRSELDSLANGITNANSIASLESAISNASSVRSDARSLKRIHQRSFDGYSNVIKNLENGADSACYSYVGCYDSSQLADLRVRKSESQSLLEDYIAFFDRAGGLEDVYDTGREQLSAAREEAAQIIIEQQQRTIALQAQNAATNATQEAQQAQLQIDTTPVSPIPDLLAAPSAVEVAADGNLDENLLAKLVTGSPISISQSVDTPDQSFTMMFDYLFESGTGTLDVFLNDTLLLELLGDSESQADFNTAEIVIDGPLLSLGDAMLTFLFNDDDSGSILWLDNIAFPGILDGDFLAGLTNWTPNGNGYAEVVNYNVSAVPLPAAFFMLAPALLGFMGFRRRAKNLAS